MKKKISILFIGNFLSETRGSKGISENIAEKLKKIGYSVVLKSRKENQILRLIDILFSILFTKSDVIHFDVYSGPAFRITELGMKVAKFRKKKTILTLHGGALPEFTANNVARVKGTLAKATILQSPSLYLIDYFKSIDVAVDYLPNPLNLINFPYKKPSSTTQKLLWVRAFTSIYNPDLAIQTLIEVQKTFPQATLTMVGPDKGLLNELSEFIEENNLIDSIQITGPIKNEELYPYYNSHDVYLNTTSYESFGVAVIEAASCGIPIVSTSVGEIPYLWTSGENILLSNEINVQEFSQLVLQLLQSKELSDKISLGARLKSETFSWDLIEPMWIQLLEKIK